MSKTGRVLIVARAPENLLKLLPRSPGRVVLAAHNCNEARDALAKHADIEWVITESSFADGNWYSVLESSVEHGDRARLLVACDRPSDRLREEVSSHGGEGVILGREVAPWVVNLSESATA